MANNTPSQNKDTKATNTTTPSPLRDLYNDFSYCCVHCSHPSDSIVRQLSASASSIQLTTCPFCGQTVDPYVERELLLVVIDWVLLRPEAYRHVLYNRRDTWESLLLSPSSASCSSTTSRTPHLPTAQRRSDNPFPLRSATLRLTQLMLSWSILQSYLVWETLRELHPNHPSLKDQYYWAATGISSFVGMILEWWAVVWLMRYYDASPESRVSATANATTTTTTTTSPDKSHKQSPPLSLQVGLALLLPCSFSVVTTLVLIWENSKTVRLLGSVLIALWQGIALWTLSYAKLTFRTTSRDKTSNYKGPQLVSWPSISPILLLYIARILWRWLCSRFISILDPFPCVGLEMILLEDTYHLCLT